MKPWLFKYVILRFLLVGCKSKVTNFCHGGVMTPDFADFFRQRKTLHGQDKKKKVKT